MALPLSAGGPGSWTTAASLHTARANHAAAMLPNGQALIVGGTGSSGTPLTSAEIFSLSSNSFTTLRTGLAVGVSGLTATVLSDNTVLLAGGVSSTGAAVATASLYDPVHSAFVKLPAMKKMRSHHTATLLTDGRVLIGDQAGDLVLGDTDGKSFSPVRGKWPPMSGGIEVPKGDVVIVGPKGAGVIHLPISNAAVVQQ